ncbi:hypothetical protein [Limobrevibacterium gyesilva]|uniref:DUF883 domain-containing protein n=1 Tax=Limobrevibacterium gyesilva TaxID=2991712 RepID=A0AA42CHH7_9PROT|nr:hypothetical protein [Limobrevibacterium gyesilva]MCW3474875.1 hypothetical protein [Limobrevibacterium gyesilva]
MTDTDYSRTIKQVGKEARDTIGTAANTADDMSHRISDAATEAGAAVREAARKVSAAAGDIGEQAIERGNRYRKDVLEHVESQPMTSVMVAAAAAFAVGLLLGRR